MVSVYTPASLTSSFQGVPPAMPQASATGATPGARHGLCLYPKHDALLTRVANAQMAGQGGSKNVRHGSKECASEKPWVADRAVRPPKCVHVHHPASLIRRLQSVSPGTRENRTLPGAYRQVRDWGINNDASSKKTWYVADAELPELAHQSVWRRNGPALTCGRSFRPSAVAHRLAGRAWSKHTAIETRSSSHASDDGP